MSVAALDRALQSVPFLNHLGVRVEESRPGSAVVRLPALPENTNHTGNLHSAALFAVGELAALVALGTHPELARLVHLQKCTKIKYMVPSGIDVTAHATITPEMVAAVRSGLEVGNAQLEVPVKLLDGKGVDIAELLGLFAFKSPD